MDEEEAEKVKAGKAQEHVHRKESILLPHPTHKHLPRFDHKQKLSDIARFSDQGGGAKKFGGLHCRN